MKVPDKIIVHNYNEAVALMSVYLMYRIPPQIQIAGILSIYAQILIQNPNLQTQNTQPK
jgi:hypothetical protein